MKENLLITGGTGFIGKRLSILAIKEGFDVTVLSLNKPSRADKIIGVKYLQADIANFSSLKKTLKSYSFTFVVNLAGYINHSYFLNEGSQIFNVHFNGVINLLRILKWKSLKRFVQIGSSDEYGNNKAPQVESMQEFPISPYSLGKHCVTNLLQMLNRNENFPSVILRLFLVYGPEQNDNRFFPQIIKGCLLNSKFPTSEGKQIRDFCYIDDITRGILMSLKNNDAIGEIINLGSGKPVTIRYVINKIKEIVGSGKPQFGKVAYRNNENTKLYADISKAKKILNWSPSIGLESGIKTVVDSFKMNC